MTAMTPAGCHVASRRVWSGAHCDMEDGLTGFAAATMAGLLANVGTEAVKSLSRARHPEIDREGDSGLLTIYDGREPLGVITGAQAHDIHKFVQDRETVALLQAWAIASVAEPRKSESPEDLALASTAFCRLADIWTDGDRGSWASLAPHLWVVLTQHIATALNAVSLSQEDRALIGSYTDPSGELATPRQPLPRFLRELIDLTGSASRLRAARQLASDISATARGIYAEARLDHIQEEHYRLDHKSIYIDRDLRNSESTQVFSSEEVLTPHGGRPRSVIIGDPGVGKSTLVQHVANKLANNEQQVYVAPFILRCREYNSVRDQSLLEVIASRVRVELHLEVSVEELSDLLVLGRLYLVLDGVDEITDLQHRRDFIRIVETFASRYPMTPVLATTRRIGYSQARFGITYFNTFELDEFSAEQVEEYAAKWFDLMGRTRLDRDTFLRESESIDEIRDNPLMLSLLCTLYRVRGYIPRNRRQVYRECADLLFTRWDAMRHIEQPIDHKQFGQKLMQELALWFYNSSQAQAGLEEGQLVKVVSQFFVDVAGVEYPESDARSRSFVDFCADRAWLLSRKGTNDAGASVFGFTHRTFLEYFAAEALVRRSENIGEIVQEIAAAYKRDASSVLPELLAQCADEKQNRGAQLVIEGLLELGRRNHVNYLALCLRVINSAPVGGYLTDKLLHSLFLSWKTDWSYTSATAAFDLYRDPRGRLMRMVMEELDKPAAESHSDIEFLKAFQLCSRWAQLYLIDRTAYYEADWLPALEPPFRALAREPAALKFTPLAAYLYEKQMIDHHSLQGYIGAEGLYSPAFESVTAGPVLRAFFRCLREATAPTTEEDRLLVADLAVSIRKGLQVENRVGGFVADAVTEQTWGWAPIDVPKVLSKGSAMAQVALWLSCLLCEEYPEATHSFHDISGGVVGRDLFERLTATRESNRVGAGSRRSNLLPHKKITELRKHYDLGVWIVNWCAAKFSIVADETPVRYTSRALTR